MSKKKTTKKPTKSSKDGISARFKKRAILGAWLIVLFPFLIISIMLLAVPEEDLPTLEQLENPRSDEATILFSEDGKVIGKFYQAANRTKIKFHDLSPNLVNALVATEDERFYSHPGVDVNALGRAVGGMMIGSNRGGASTISQQLAKMMFHERPGSKWGRMKQKFAEWIIAARIERSYTKNEIIAMYFNQFDYLHTAVGIHSACKVYFNTTPDKITVEQAATLVGMFKSPSIYNPKSNPENAHRRRMVVLKQMQKNNFLTQQEYDSLKVLPLELDYKPELQYAGLAPYFRDYIRNEVKTILNNPVIRKPDGKSYNVYNDGLRIYTTLDSRMQAYAEEALENYLKTELQPAFEKDISKNNNKPFANNVDKTSAENAIKRGMKQSERYRKLKEEGLSEKEIEANFKTPVTMKVFDWKTPELEKEVEMSPWDSIKYHKAILRAGLVSVDPHTGFVKAWVGGPNHKYFKYDMVAQGRRQAGSTMKPFVYATAIRDGIITPCSEFPSNRECIEVPNGNTIKLWCPAGEKDYDGVSTPVYYGLTQSMNNITAKIINMQGGTNAGVVKLFEDMGLEKGRLESVPSLGLGVCDLTLLEMTSAQAMLANMGIYNTPVTVLRIEDRNGKVIYDANVQVKEVLDGETAYEIVKMMKGATGVRRPADGKPGGTAGRLRNYFTAPVACKTGTTQNGSDAWFMGLTPDLVTGVWIGGEDMSVRFSERSGMGYGGKMALPIWGLYMKKVYADKSIRLNRADFEPPALGLSPVIDCSKEEPPGFGF
jgi:penicillin-binding protein 1A